MDPNTIERLERLGRLRADGSLTEEEFATAKAALLSGDLSDPRLTSGVDGLVRAGKGPELSDTWRRRFDFIDAHGLPNTPSSKAALKAIPFWSRSRLTNSIAGFIVGPFYFLYLGLWRPDVSIFAGSIALDVLATSLGLPDWCDRAIGFGAAGVYSVTAVPLYYLYIRRGIHSWNPLIWLRAGDRGQAAPPPSSGL